MLNHNFGKFKMRIVKIHGGRDLDALGLGASLHEEEEIERKGERMSCRL